MSRRLRMPTRRQIVFLTIAAACVTLFSVLVPLQTSVYGTTVALSFLLAAALCGAPLLMLSHPRLATGASAVAMVLLGLLVSPTVAEHAPWPWSVPAMLAFLLIVGVATVVHGPKHGAIPLGLGLAGSLIVVMLRPDVIADADAAAAISADLIVGASLAIGVYVIALLLAGRMRIGAELDRERAVSASEQERRLLIEERTRIARDLHDVVAHSMSVIQVQAATARYRVDGLSDEAAAEFDSIAATARTSLTEMRRLLGVLRTEDGAAELAPQQGLADIPALIDSIRRSGAEVALEQRTDASEVPMAVDLAAFRIVQEALSNALRHSPGAPIAVSLDADDRAVRVRVRNAATTAPQAAPTQARSEPGHGLRGMRERAAMLSGSVQASATADGGWLVDARLPFETSDSPDTPDTPDTQEAP